LQFASSGEAFRMNTSIVMPQLGLTMTEGTVGEWLKKPGDFIRKNEPVLIISTDKAEVEVESLVEGTLGKIIVEGGTTVAVGTILAYMEGGAGDAGSIATEQPSAQTQQEDKPATAKSAQPSVLPEREALKSAGSSGRVSPRAKRLAQELGVQTGQLRGSGNNGEIVEDDVRRAIPPQNKAAHPNLRRRQLIAERLTRSIQTIPTFSVAAEANAEKLVTLHESLRQPPMPGGVKLTITDLLLAIFASALKASPEICATWENNAPRDNSSVDIGLAVATPEGVVAPVLRNVDALNLTQLSAKRHEFAEKARAGKLSLSELEGGVSTLSNLGMYRVDHFEALISPGQSSILAVGSIRKRPWVSETLVVKPTVIFNLTVDHRIADGAVAAAFLGKLIALIEEPSSQPLRDASSRSDGASRGSRD
jgi:pyruvate dehydrogenase E2 component (dihydrolipoamide acetyltransferase)